MGIKIFLRKSAASNSFQRIIMSAVSSGLGQKAILCSGFFQDNHAGSAYKVSCEGCFACEAATKKLQLKTIGVHNNHWVPTYRNFVQNMTSRGVILQPLIAKKLKWHAKVFIYLVNNCPAIVMIGSSNMTRNAFGTSEPFNYECDVVLWDSTISGTLNIVQSDRDIINPHEVITADYLPEKNANLSISERMNEILKEIEAIPVIDFV